MNILSPAYSFVQFAPGASPAICNYKLPIALDNDLKFQATAQTANLAESTNLINNTQSLYVVSNGAVITNEATLAANKILDLANPFAVNQVSATSLILCWSYGLASISGLADGTCFRLCLRLDDGTNAEYYLSNCFIKVSDITYYSTLEYWSNVNNYDFNYCNACVNKIRLPFYLGQPQPTEDQKIYINQAGERTLLKYQAFKSYVLETDYLPEEVHDRIITALAHDAVNVVSGRYTGGIRKDGNYAIAWDRMQDEEAPATAKVFATPYIIENNNCNDCTSDVYCASVSDILGYAEETPVVCADISDIIGVASEESVLIALLTVTLSRDGTTLTATASGGTPPYTYHFYCVPVGTCNSFSISNPDQVSSGAVSTPYTYTNYAGTTYNFYVDVIDAALDAGSDGPNTPATCLVPGTLISLADGVQKILEEIMAGDKLLDMDALTGEARETFATSVTEFETDKIFSINKGLLKTSEGHVNVIKDGGEVCLVQTCDLLIGDYLINDKNELVEIVSIDVEEGKFKIINLATQSQTFIANGILTHNKLACP